MKTLHISRVSSLADARNDDAVRPIDEHPRVLLNRGRYAKRMRPSDAASRLDFVSVRILCTQVVDIQCEVVIRCRVT